MVLTPFWGPPSLLSNAYRWLLPPGVEQPGHEADHSPPSSAEVIYIHSPNTSSWRGIQLRTRITLLSPIVRGFRAILFVR
jgi:hypothetical protein